MQERVAYVRVLTGRGGCKHNFSKDRRVRQRWRRSHRGRKLPRKGKLQGAVAWRYT
jgi:hypothetical protein